MAETETPSRTRIELARTTAADVHRAAELLPEFERRVLEVLREPLETGHITISRAAHQTDFPASFQLIAAMNPCPCGYRGDPRRECQCTPQQVEKYVGKISGPLLDRIDIQLEVPAVPFRDLSASRPGTSSARSVTSPRFPIGVATTYNAARLSFSRS